MSTTKTRLEFRPTSHLLEKLSQLCGVAKKNCSREAGSHVATMVRAPGLASHKHSRHALDPTGWRKGTTAWPDLQRVSPPSPSSHCQVSAHTLCDLLIRTKRLKKEETGCLRGKGCVSEFVQCDRGGAGPMTLLGVHRAKCACVQGCSSRSPQHARARATRPHSTPAGSREQPAGRWWQESVPGAADASPGRDRKQRSGVNRAGRGG